MQKLACPKCHEPLILEGRSYKCTNRHCYDIAKSGYINLLLNPDKATNNPGDNKESLLCRKAHLNAGYYDVILNEVIQCIKEKDDTNMQILSLKEISLVFLHQKLQLNLELFTPQSETK